MPQLVRLTYASTTTAKPATIRQDLQDIMQEAQLHNTNNAIGGVLYYGNDYFFQWLEGRKSQIDVLYKKILKDERHKEIVLLSYEPIDSPRFPGWELKYVRQDQQVVQFFSQMQWEKFNPYALKGMLIELFMDMLVQHPGMQPGEEEQVMWSHLTRKANIVLNLLSVVLVVGFLSLLVLYLLYTAPAMG